jgi:hypothetical protein
VALCRLFATQHPSIHRRVAACCARRASASPCGCSRLQASENADRVASDCTFVWALWAFGQCMPRLQRASSKSASPLCAPHQFRFPIFFRESMDFTSNNQAVAKCRPAPTNSMNDQPASKGRKKTICRCGKPFDCRCGPDYPMYPIQTQPSK